jgi:hypothetical protein
MVDVSDPRPHHGMLQKIFDLERTWRERSGRFGAQAIFGAGRQETLRWLSENGYADECAHLSEWLSHAEDPKIEDWAREVRNYFYSPDGVLP